MQGPTRAVALTAIAALVSACSSEGIIRQPAGCVSGAAEDGTFTFAVGQTCLEGVRLRVRSGGAFREPGADDALRIEAPVDGVLRIVASAPGPVEAFEITIPGVPGDAILQQGYQSWSFSGVVPIPESLPLGSDGGQQLAAARSGDALLETAGVSYGSAVIGSQGGPFLIAGALSAEHATTGVTAVRAASGSGADVVITYGALREPLRASASGKVESEPLHVAVAANANEGLAAFASAMKAALPAGAITPKRPPGGWFSWNELFAKVSEDDVLAHVDVIASQLAPAGMPLVEIDDGWERAWGDWTANSRFPNGMEAVGAAITAKGLTAGVWLAPFLVAIDSDVAKTTDPALFVQTDDGVPLVHTPSGSVFQYYVLDGTNPASMAIAADAIAQLHTAGFRFFKLDFLYAGALPGMRKDGAATGNEALRGGLALLRQAMGDDSVFNACGAPILPVLGLADSLRVGTDTAFDGLMLTFPLVTAAARSLAARAYLAPLTWPDADQTQLRAPYSDDEARASAVVAALAGPAYALGDDLTKLDPARLAMALDPDLIDLAGAASPATPDDLFESPTGAVVKSPLLDSAEKSLAPPPTSWSAVGKSGAKYTVKFSWDAPHQVTITKKP